MLSPYRLLNIQHIGHAAPTMFGPVCISGLFLWVATMQYSTPPVEKNLGRCWLFMVDLSLRKWSRSIARCLWEAEIWGLHRMIGPGSLVVGSWFPSLNHELVGEVIRNHLISVVRNLTFSGNDILVIGFSSHHFVCYFMILEVLSGGACQLCCFWAFLNKTEVDSMETCCTLEIARPIVQESSWKRYRIWTVQKQTN